jgi:ketosteroid isomerase-like protein
MLACGKCHAEHDDGTEFCQKCGSPLTAIEDSRVALSELPPFGEAKAQAEEDSSESLSSLLSDETVEVEEPPQKRLVCSRCKLIYEGRETCIRCGASLVEQGASQENERHLTSEALEVEERAVIRETPQSEEEILPFRWEDTQPVSSPELFPLTGRTEEGGEVPKQGPTPKTSESRVERKVILPKKKKFNFRRLPLEALSVLILVIAAGYLLWSLYSNFMKRPEAGGSLSKGGTQAILTGASAASPPLAPPSTAAQINALPEMSQEIEEIKGLLENIRKANLEKNIELFMSCYASDFKDREGKRRAALEAWKDFDYRDLSFDLTKESISGQTARAKVEWLVKISSKNGGSPEESKTAMDVLFKKEDTGWKIKETKP